MCYPIWKPFVFKGASYKSHGNTILHEHMKYNNQHKYDPTIQYFVWGNSSELKSENKKVSGSVSIHVINQVNLDDNNFWRLRSHMWIKYVRCRLPNIYIIYFWWIKTTKKVKRRGRRLMMIPFVFIHFSQSPRIHILHTIRYG